MIFEKTNSKISYCSVAFFTGLSLGAGPEKVVTATHLSQGGGGVCYPPEPGGGGGDWLPT